MGVNPNVENARQSLAKLATDAAEHADLFRREAVEYYAQQAERAVVLRVAPPWTWTLVISVAVLLLVMLALSVFGKIEIIDRTRGIVRPAAGIRSLRARATGVVASVSAQSGDYVGLASELIHLDVIETLSSLKDARARLELANRVAQRAALEEERNYHQQMLALQSRQEILAQQVKSLESSVVRANQIAATQAQLENSGVASRIDILKAEDARDRARRELDSTRQLIEQTRQELANVRLEHESRDRERHQEIDAASNQVTAREILLEAASVRAPISGYVESVLVHKGDVVEAGTEIARLVPADATMEVVTFLPERDRAFVAPGHEALLEFDQFPFQEYGTARAHITRVGQDLATLVELRQVFGETYAPTGPVFSIQLQIDDGGPRLQQTLRSGMQVTVRFTLRKQRPLSFITEPVLRGRISR